MDRTTVTQFVVDTVKNHPGKWALVLAGLFLIPYFTYQNMKERRAAELTDAFTITDKPPHVKLLVDGFNVTAVYADETRLPADGIGVAVITWDDYVKDVERFKQITIPTKDFPAVVFFNATGFDTTGLPKVIRRVTDGKLLWESPGEAQSLAALVLADLRRRDFRVVATATRPAARSRSTTSTGQYMGVEPPSAAGRDVTDDQLAKLGLQKIPMAKKEETPKETPKEVLKSPPAKTETFKSGIKGNIVEVSGIKAAKPVVEARVFSFTPARSSP